MAVDVTTRPWSCNDDDRKGGAISTNESTGRAEAAVESVATRRTAETVDLLAVFFSLVVEADFLGAPEREVVGVGGSRFFFGVERTLGTELLVVATTSRGVGVAASVLVAVTFVFALEGSVLVENLAFTETTTPGPVPAFVLDFEAADRAVCVFRSRMIVSLNGHARLEG